LKPHFKKLALNSGCENPSDAQLDFAKSENLYKKGLKRCSDSDARKMKACEAHLILENNL
jgi:hypothetical protein